MIVTIDRAGRIVVPKPFRDRFNLVPGTELAIEASGDGVTLRKVGAEPSLIRKKGILVHHGGDRVAVDIVEFTRAEREARSRRIASALD